MRKLLEQIQEWLDDTKETGAFSKGYRKALIDCKNLIKGRHYGWIPVTERLPREWQEVLCQWESGDKYRNEIRIYISILHRIDEKEWVGSSGKPNGKVIAWMPLPEPYKKKKRK